MFSRLFPSRSALKVPLRSIPSGERIYAIGDVHGRLDLTQKLLAIIGEDNARRAPAKSQVIFLGDLIDRGPQSADVVEYARNLENDTFSYRFLLGNHEEVFLKALAGDLKALTFFTRIGGRETILSYGVSESEYLKCDYPELLEFLTARVPRNHVEFFNRFDDMIVAGDYAFVHAGIKPGRPLAHQRPHDLRWIRSEFLDYPSPHEKIIVHGHTITHDVQFMQNRIGIDTGAYRSDKLTAIGLEAGERWILATSG